MSYILDALKKSEEARGNASHHEGRKELPELPALPSRTSGSPRRRPYMVAFLLVLSVSYLVYRLGSRPRSALPPPAQLADVRPALPPADNRRSVKPNPQSAPAIAPAQTRPSGKSVEVRQPAEKKSASVSAVSPPAAVASLGAPAAAKAPKEPPAKEKLRKPNPSGPAPINQATVKPAPTSPPPHPVALATVKASAAASIPKGPPAKKEIRKPAPSRPAPSPRRVEVAAKKPPLPEPSHGSTSQQSALALKAARLKELLEKQAEHTGGPPGSASRRQNLADIRSFAAPDASSEPRVSSFGRLPLRIRESLPNISVSMLVYSRQPAERFIYINGTREHEGEQISPGLKLERITPDGAVFSYLGVHFYKSVIGN